MLCFALCGEQNNSKLCTCVAEHVRVAALSRCACTVFPKALQRKCHESVYGLKKLGLDMTGSPDAVNFRL